jgi:hypothetical protein
MKVHGAIIDVEIGMAEFENGNDYGFMPILKCPNCNNENMQRTIRSAPRALSSML